MAGVEDLPVQEKNSLKTMFNPPHPGEVLVQYLGGMSVVDAAAKIGIGQEHLARLIHGQTSIDPKLAVKLGRAFGTSPELWTGMQSAHDNRMPSSMVPEIHSSLKDLADGQVTPYQFGDAKE